ncbi:MAG: hypothetical protein R3B51_01310 [Thermodesulfobacteriota bacterium]
MLFIDEIHRFNKSQQAALPSKASENGTLVLIGRRRRTRRSRCISPPALEPYTSSNPHAGGPENLLDRALGEDDNKGRWSRPRGEELVTQSGRDARVMLNTLEVAYDISGLWGRRRRDHAGRRSGGVSDTSLQIRQGGGEHYNTISALIKSVRGSDPDAAVYYLARMLEAGRTRNSSRGGLSSSPSEDIGKRREPYALTLATAAFTAVDYVGMPEGEPDTRTGGDVPRAARRVMGLVQGDSERFFGGEEKARGGDTDAP